MSSCGSSDSGGQTSAQTTRQKCRDDRQTGRCDARNAVAQQRVAVAFDESVQGLAVTDEEEIEPGTAWAISLRSRSSGDLYRVSVVRLKARAIRTLVTRTHPDAEQVTKQGTNRAG